MSRQEIFDRFHTQVAQGQPIIGDGTGTGITAKPMEAGDISLLVICNSGRFRMAGRGSLSGLLAYGDANAIVMEMANEVLPVVKRTPALAGVNGTDPFRVMRHFLRQVKEIGLANVQNFPTVDLIGGVFRVNLEETGMGCGHEIDTIRMAHELDLLISPHIFDEDQAKDMARTGADILVPYMDLTTPGTIGAKTALTPEEAAVKAQQLADAARSVNPDILCLCHGGPIVNPADAQYILGHTDGIVGLYGVSSIERSPTEVGIRAQTEELKAATFKRD